MLVLMVYFEIEMQPSYIRYLRALSFPIVLLSYRPRWNCKYVDCIY
jgi:hypothetical protein